MSVTDILVPRLAESISEATLVEWLKADGANVNTDEPVATLETDKAAVEIVANGSGVLRHGREPGATVQVGDVLGRIEPGNGAAAATPAPAAKPAAKPAASPKATAPAVAAPPAGAPAPLSPAVRRLVEEHALEPGAIAASGKGGRLLKEDVLRHLEAPAASTPAPAAPAASAAAPMPVADGSGERVVPMSRIRLRIAERLVRAQQTAAILTTFNEVDLSRVIDARARYKDAFEKKHGVRLGFMSFFARACVLAMGEVPEVNAEIRDTDIVYHDHVHIGVAASTERGLVVPVVRHVERLDFAGIEREIARLADLARTARISPDDLSGGTFTITNGGVFGSLLSTPILNPPQSAILGMHKIEKRPIVVDDQVVVRPMMYLALSYDHRLIDGEQAVTFLVRVKERLEDPERMLLAV